MDPQDEISMPRWEDTDTTHQPLKIALAVRRLLSAERMDQRIPPVTMMFPLLALIQLPSNWWVGLVPD